MVFLPPKLKMMVARFWCLVFILAFSSACFGAKNKSIKKRSKVPWFEERANHAARGLSDAELQNVSALGDEQHFYQMLKPILIPRVADTPGHTAVRQFIVSQIDSLNWTVEQDQFVANTPVGRKTFTNVIATLNPSATRRLVIACHYDSKLTPEGFLGAIDSAVPCSMMLNLAHILKGPLDAHRRQRNDLTLQFMFIDGEEAFVQWSATDSLYGARNLANNLHKAAFPPGGLQQTTELDRIDLFVLLDLIGTEDCGFFSFFGESEAWYSRLASFEKRLSNMKLINPRKPIFRERTYYGANIEDDHVPFLKKGVPILHLISAPFPSVWHKMSDNFESLHPPTIANLNTILRAFVVDYLHLDL